MKKDYKENPNLAVWAFLVQNYEGIGRYKAKGIVNSFYIGTFTKIGLIDKNLLKRLLRFMKLNYSISLKLLRRNLFKYYFSIGHLSGIRFNLNLPVHSNRTKTNAKTRKKWKIF